MKSALPSPRVAAAITSRVSKQVSALLVGHSGPSGLSQEESESISNSVMHFLSQQHGITERQLQSLARILLDSIVERRSKLPAASPRHQRTQTELEQKQQQQQHAIPAPPVVPKKKEDKCESMLPSISPRRPPVIIPPFATGEADVSIADGSVVSARRRSLSEALDEQLRLQGHAKQKERQARDEERAARVGHLQQAESIQTDFKKVKKQLRKLQGQEYDLFVRERDTEMLKQKLEKALQDRSARKDLESHEQREKETAHLLKLKKQAIEAAMLDEQLHDEASRRIQEREADKQLISNPLVFGISPEEQRKAAILRRMSLARGLEAQMSVSACT